MRRFGSVAAASAKLLPMPKLSPDMEFGTVEKWMIKPGSLIKPYQLVLEISTESALNSSVIYIMEVEITEKLYLSKILVKDGQKVNVGSPIAIFCKDEDQIEIASKLEFSAEDDVKDSPQGIPMASWHASRKTEKLGCYLM